MSGARYKYDGPVKALFGLEADCESDDDKYWRMGYAYPVQLSQWTLASSRGHPILSFYMNNLKDILHKVKSHHNGNISSEGARRELRQIGTLELTGPAALTGAAKTWLQESAAVRWNSLTGLKDHGASKLVEDVLILPITAFR